MHCMEAALLNTSSYISTFHLEYRHIVEHLLGIYQQRRAWMPCWRAAELAVPHAGQLPALCLTGAHVGVTAPALP